MKQPASSAALRQPRALDYWVPMVAFGLFTWFEPYLTAQQFPVAYVVKAVVVTACVFIFRGPLSEIRVQPAVVLPSVLIGLIVFVLWVGIDQYVPYQHLGSRTAFDPSPMRGSPGWIAFLAVRLYGLVLLVPVIEEILWRSFLLRFLTQADFRQLAVGTFSASALWWMVAGSAVSHPEWLVAAIASLIYALWLRRTRSLFASIVAHATTNAALGIYVISTGSWQYW
ncbi:MAG TPA: CAAX prenyl protease-related protein [Vicinamibacterales bacterium]|nr:CAAX prenyl protease-related protein [Vicinamibacterales bacterium]